MLNVGHDSISDEIYGQCWDLDSTDNWTGMKQAADGTDWTLQQSRTANKVNEITNISNIVGIPWAQPEYDAAGNMTRIPWPSAPATELSWTKFSTDPWGAFTADEWAGFQAASALFATWDAWNRLVKLADGVNTLAEYEYDAANRRIVKKLYTNGTLNQTRHRYQTSQDQLIEVCVDSSTDPIEQNIWGLRYIDDLILRDRDTNNDGNLNERLYCLQDANWNAVALADIDGNVTQRFCYEPFGTCSFLTADYDSGTNDSAWTTLFTGRELDLESLLYNFRARSFSSWTGGFLTQDQIGYADGPNLYAAYFVPDSVDPDGNMCIRIQRKYDIKLKSWNGSIPVYGVIKLYGSIGLKATVDTTGEVCDICCANGKEGKSSKVRVRGRFGLTGSVTLGWQPGKNGRNLEAFGGVFTGYIGLKGETWAYASVSGEGQFTTCNPGGQFKVCGKVDARFRLSGGAMFKYRYGRWFTWDLGVQAYGQVFYRGAGGCLIFDQNGFVGFEDNQAGTWTDWSAYWEACAGGCVRGSIL